MNNLVVNGIKGSITRGTI